MLYYCVHYVILTPGQTVNKEYYLSVMRLLHEASFLKRVLPPNPPYSPDLVPVTRDQGTHSESIEKTNKKRR